MNRLVQQLKPISERLSKSLSTMWVNDFSRIVREAIGEANTSGSGSGDKRHWLVPIGGTGLQFESQENLYDYYVHCVASVVKSKDEAKERIYIASCKPSFGFGVRFDDHEIIKFRRRIGAFPIQDFHYAARPKNSSVVHQFTPRNQNHRVDNIFSYQRLSEPSAEWNSNYWLVTTVRRPSGFTDRGASIRFCIKILADVVGSEDAAKKMIYMVWMEKPHGFAAKMDEDTLNKLKVAPDVVSVHPDYSFDVNKITEDGMTLFIIA